ncbi:MAG TPA: ester cyclase [Candidatus Binatia bacterium]|jgi:steroid delta-isomerase-like uncharacterized protein|nr:ester cyclase [Candidatus Binatia bacterium]
MSEENKAIVRRYVEEAFNNRNTDLLDELVSEHLVDHHIPPELPPGPEGIKLWFNGAFGAFPDCQITVKDMIAEGDKVATRFEFTGTHQGEFMGIPATGKQFSITGMAVARVADGMLAEWWENTDVMSMMQQLGVVPMPGAE